MSKGHIWPKAYAKFAPSDATFHIQKLNTFQTFESKIRTPPTSQIVRTGAVHSHRRRNTCTDCNRGWMSQIEENALATVEVLATGDALVEWICLDLLAAFLCLVASRARLGYPDLPPLPQDEIDALRFDRRPTDRWRVWIGKFVGPTAAFQYNYAPMQLVDSMPAPFGPEHVNTEVMSLTVGKLYAHIFYSTEWPNFAGYEGVELTSVWPSRYLTVDSRAMTQVDENLYLLIHEAIARDGRPG